MSEHPAPRPAPSTVTEGDAVLWQPVLLRAVAALAFGAATVFLTVPTTAGMGVLAGAYFVLVGAALLLVVRRLAASLSLSASSAPVLALAVPAAHLAVAGVVAAVAGSPELLGWYGAFALALLGLGELYAAVALKGRTVLSRDWLVSGVVMLGTAAVLPFVAAAGAKAVLGVTGGGALITGALWLLCALTIRHDGRASAKAVN